MTDQSVIPTTTDLSVSAAIERGAATPQMHDPATLLVDVNVRTDVRLNQSFLNSIRDRGVLSPVIAVLTIDGGVRVRMGHKRTLAALEVGRQVPVIIVGNEATDDTASIERILDQFAENEHRSGLSISDQIGVAEQLSLYGVSAAQITKRTQMPRKQVDAALSVAKSPLAKAAASRYDFLTLDQALAVAEFEDIPETVKALVADSKSGGGQFEHIAQRARDKRAEQDERTAAETLLTQAGITVIPPGSISKDSFKALSALTNDEDTREALTPETHATCPGHAAYLHQVWVSAQNATRPQSDEDDDTDEESTDDDQDDLDDQDDQDDEDDEDEVQAVGGGYQWKPVYVCTTPEAGHFPRFKSLPTPAAAPGARKVADMTETEREENAKIRRGVVRCNKKWESAQKVRGNWLKDFAARQRPPKGTGAFLATAMAYDGDTYSDVSGNALAAKLLSVDTTGYGRNRGIAELISKAAEPRALVIHLVMVLAVYEAKTNREDWRTLNPRTQRYLRQLATIGYPLSPVEARATGVTPDTDEDPDADEDPDTEPEQPEPATEDEPDTSTE